MLAEHVLFPRLGIARYRADGNNHRLNRAATVVWPLAIGLAFN